MARYIDADKYVEYLEKEICSKCIDEVCGACGLDSARWIAEEFPTEDVVPKSEVDKAYARGFERGKKANVCGFSAKELAAKIERLSVDLEAMRMAANSYKIHYEKVKSEVAREIFEEIEQRINFEKNRWHEYWEKSGDQNAIIRQQTCVLIMYHLEAVKEKYTEGKYEN